MFLKAVLSTVLIAGLAQASPVPVERRELGGILICNEPNAQGHCEYGVYKLETCYNLPPALIHNAATFAPDGEAFFCYPYLMECGGICTSPEGCTLGAVSFNYEHKFNLTATGWNKYITSFDCHSNKTTTPETWRR
ncbi:f6256023-dea7-4ad9-b616-15c82cfef3ce [Thermothielavioides terrestris]|uniref:F6256023-dea7-4ad9-b616-15c82cfef3ce n=1 Tax=Thermothielavioides terrestris TaxID=2587410 RepID=A0A446BUQ4_9PEZI|nr:f6256023-dea7-4ad9-b616-15c82cfef3ce [Thermothielavioides terrestris]